MSPSIRAVVVLALLAACGSPEVRAARSPAEPGASPAGTRPPAHVDALPDYDARLDRGTRLAAALAVRAGTAKASDFVAGPAAQPGSARLAALAALEAQLGRALTVAWDEVTGSPHALWASTGFLSEADGRAPSAIARGFLAAHGDLFLLTPDQVARLQVEAEVPLPSGGTVVHLRQVIDGFDVLHGHVAVSLAKDGSVAHVAGGGVTGAGTLVRTSAEHSPAQALAALARVVGVSVAALPTPTGGAGDETRFAAGGGLAGAAAVRLVVVPTVHGPQLGWESVLRPMTGRSTYEVAVDDRLLQPLRRTPLTHWADTRGRVFENNPGATPQVLRPFVDTQVFRSSLSPLGWATADLTEGNNCVVRDDRADDDDLTLGILAQATPGGFLAFDFPYTNDPNSDLELGVTNAFFALNVAHDHFQRLGFDEPSGNFQTDNRGRGGLGGDAVIGDVQDGGGTNNANFSTPPDGTPGRVQVYNWDASGQLRDGALDMGLIFHEFAHGLSTRLVGGPQRVGCLFGLQGGSMGEGWGDFFAASFLDDPVMGAWISGDATVGIRMFALDDNPATGKDYRDFCTYPNDFAPTFCEVHDNGEIWSGLLWALREAYVATYGSAGVGMVEQLAVDALKLTPCNPSMVDARDALILADRLETGGANACLIRQVSAAHWIGFGSASNGGADTDPTATNTPWPECVQVGEVLFTREGLEAGATLARYACEDQVTVSVTDGNAVAPVMVSITTSGGDAEMLQLAAGAAPAVYLGSIPAFERVPNVGDGNLDVTAGDVLTATYIDPDRATPATATAEVACTARIEIARYRIRNSTCDDDLVPGFPNLPGYLDAGESADLVLTLANRMAVAVEGMVQVTTDRPDLIQAILPTTAVFRISLPPAIGAVPSETEVTLRLVAADNIIPPDDIANIEVRLIAPGYDGSVPYVVPLQLQRDYALAAGLVATYDMESETGPGVGPEWTTGTLDVVVGNQWTLVTCANTTPAGTQSYRNGPANCAGNYSDMQGDPYIASPALPLATPTAVAVRLTGVGLFHDVNLGSAGVPMFGIPPTFDAEAVGLIATNDPTATDTSDVFVLVEGALGFWAQLPAFGIQSNTAGFQFEFVPTAAAQLSAVDLLQPTYLSWLFLPDVTPSTFMGFPFSAQGRGYYFDDVDLGFERVEPMPQATACTASLTVFAYPRITDPLSGVACGGAAVTIDASLSSAFGCSPAGALQYRFLDAATAQLLDCDADTLPDDWGAADTCIDVPTTDRTYLVEVRCTDDPLLVDGRTVSVSVVAANPSLVADPASSCNAMPGAIITLDGSASVLDGCPQGLEYRFLDGLLLPFDCDGDTLPDDFAGASSCVVPAPPGGETYTIEVRCAGGAGACIASTQVLVPALTITPVASEADPMASPYCAGTPFAVTAAGSQLFGCTTGVAEYRWTTLEGFDSGFTTQLDALPSLMADGNVELEVRCSTDSTCVSRTVLPIDVVAGAALLTPRLPGPDCAGAPLELDATGSTTECTNALEFRFFRDGLPLDCDGDTLADDWGPSGTCDTVLVMGGADYEVEARCAASPACVATLTTPVTVTPGTGVPVGTPLGTLRVTKTAGCPGPGDVVLAWDDTGLVPLSFALFRDDDPEDMVPLERFADIDGGSGYVDTGAACDGGGLPYRGVAIWFYVFTARNACNGDPLP